MAKNYFVCANFNFDVHNYIVFIGFSINFSISSSSTPISVVKTVISCMCHLAEHFQSKFIVERCGVRRTWPRLNRQCWRMSDNLCDDWMRSFACWTPRDPCRLVYLIPRDPCRLMYLVRRTPAGPPCATWWILWGNCSADGKAPCCHCGCRGQCEGITRCDHQPFNGYPLLSLLAFAAEGL